MPITLRTRQLSVKDTSTGEYEGLDVFANQTTAQMVADVTAAGSTAIQQIEDKGEEVLESIPDDYTELVEDVDDLKSVIVALSAFNGNTPEEKLYTALITRGNRRSIECGEITINNTITIPNATLRSAKIINSTIRLNADMFAVSGAWMHIPTFINCRFIGNGHSISAGGYTISGYFINCVFENCSLYNDPTELLQSPHVIGCEITNTTVPFIKAKCITDAHIDNVMCEGGTTFIDTLNSTDINGGTHDLWISNSIFEGFNSRVLSLSGGSIVIKDCYLEANVKGTMLVKRNVGVNAGNILNLEISGCFIYAQEDTTETSEDTSTCTDQFIISGFEKSDTVTISVHNNYYKTHNNINVPLVSGIVGDDMFLVYSNRINRSEVICNEALPVFDPVNILEPTIHQNLRLISGGYIQFGSLAYIDMIISIKTAVTNLENAISNLPNTACGTSVFVLPEAPYQPLKKYDFYTTILASGVLAEGPTGRYAWCFSVVPGSTITVTNGAVYGLYAEVPILGETVSIDSARHVGLLNNRQITIPDNAYYIVICSDTGEPYVRIPKETETKLRISGTSGDIFGQLSVGESYSVKGFYFTNKKTVR